MFHFQAYFCKKDYSLILRILYFVCIILFFGLLASRLLRFLEKANGGSKSRIEKDRKALKLLNAGFEEEMVPISNEELFLLSSELESEQIEKGAFYTERGLLNSIYNEPIVSYSYRNYGNGKSLLVASTNESTFEFLERDEVIELKINGYVQGLIQEDSTLKGVHGELIAAIENDYRSDYQSLTIGETKVAEFINPNSKTSENNKRMFLELKPLNQVEQNILLGMTIYNTLIKN